ncbi:MAG: membrane protein insertion efficiency factor YidD [Vulcanimicrobiota bacterium]
MRLGERVIRTYQRYISADYNGARHAHCAYYPSCSEHARQSLAQDGPVDGTTHALGRYWSCGPEAHERNMHEYLHELHHDPQAALALTDFENDASRAQFERLQSMAQQFEPGLHSQQVLEQRRAEAGLAAAWNRWSENFELLRYDQPDQARQGFLIRPRSPRPPAPERSSWQRLAIAAGGAVAGLIGGVVGAVAGGVLGLAAGGGLTVAVANRSQDRFEQAQQERYGQPGIDGVRSHLGHLTEPTRRLRQGLEEVGLTKLTAGVVAGLVGSLWALPAGLVSGVVGGAKTGATMAAALGRNASAEALGVARPVDHPHLRA